MKSRRKLELLIEDLEGAVAIQDPKIRRERLMAAAWDLRSFSKDLLSNPPVMGSLIVALRRVRDAGGPGSMTAEREIMDWLLYVLPEVDAPLGADKGGVQGVARTDTVSTQVLQLLAGYAWDCLEFSRKRDAFAGQRRALAFELLADVRQWIPMPEVEQKALAALAKADGDEARGAMEFFRRLLEQEDAEPNPTLVEALLNVVEGTRHRSVAFGALDLLVSTRTISEFEALDRMDAWKERHR